MNVTRRAFLTTGSMAAAVAAAPRAFAQWQPSHCANLCFGGTYRNRLFMAASTSLYSLYVNTQGVLGG